LRIRTYGWKMAILEKVVITILAGWGLCAILALHTKYGWSWGQSLI
jgi:hypothetical protein